jgi:pimeloyl-ACP methyl ester carboxylesterase
MADDAAAVIRALGLRQVDVLGFSLGGYQALDLTWRHPALVRKLMLLGTGPRGGNPEMDRGVLSTAPRPVPGLRGFPLPVLRPVGAGRSRPRATSGSGVTSAWTRIRLPHRR